MTKLLHGSIATVMTAALFGLTACHGSSTSGPSYVPQAGAVPAGMQAKASPATSPINASCKTPIRVGTQKDKTCHFKETGYKGIFTIDEHLGGSAVVRPHKGTKDTQFIVRLSPGDGYFNVDDANGNALKVGVTVPQAPIVSTCGRKITIQIAGIVTCQFHEDGYDGQYTIDSSHLSGIASVSPGQGDKTTQFTVLGLLEGGGYFIVHGARNLRVHVLVTTL